MFEEIIVNIFEEICITYKKLLYLCSEYLIIIAMKQMVLEEEPTLKKQSSSGRTARMTSSRSKLLTPKLFKPVLMTEEAFNKWFCYA